MKLIISGVSGSGKSTIIDYLISKYKFELAKSYTTRVKRFESENEYIFVLHEEFQNLIEKQFFFEYEYLFSNYYGTPAHYLNQNNIIFNVDVKGMQKINNLTRCTTVFISPPSKNVLIDRLLLRGENNIDLRLERFEYEESFSNLYDHVVINDDLFICLQEIEKIISCS